MIAGRDTVIISSLEWDKLWQGPHEIATRFSTSANRVLYIENTGIRSIRVGDSSRVIERLVSWARGLRTGGIRNIAPNIWVTSPLVLPPFGRGFAGFLNRKVLLRAIPRASSKLSFHNPIIWTFLPTDTANRMIRSLRGRDSFIVYYCVADFAELTSDPQALQRSEAELITMADVVFAQNEELAEHCRRWNTDVHVFPFGVNIEVLQAVAGAPVKFPDTPLIGYVGGLHRHLDVNLLLAACRATPTWTWVFVGPEQNPMPSLAALPNVRFVGSQPHQQLGSWIQHFDVCVVPYAESRYTETVVPTKINEYLALGKPVVATSLPAVKQFNEEHDVIEVVPPDPEKFVAAIEANLGELDPNDAEKRRRVAGLSDWRIRLEEMTQIIEERATSPRVRPPA